jgi:flavin reductase (DIM6/NTAB) family NADH-FMN oxidoreductase RutF
VTALGELVDDLDYPMMIVTAAAAGEHAGCLVGFASQCSIDPGRFMVWLSNKNHTFRVASRATSLVVHFPSSDQVELARLFGEETGDDVDKFAQCSWSAGPDGTPVLDDCVRWFAGRILDRLTGGDHVGYLLDPFEASTGDWSGQLTFQQLRHLEPGHEA